MAAKTALQPDFRLFELDLPCACDGAGDAPASHKAIRSVAQVVDRQNDSKPSLFMTVITLVPSFWPDTKEAAALFSIFPSIVHFGRYNAMQQSQSLLLFCSTRFPSFLDFSLTCIEFREDKQARVLFVLRRFSTSAETKWVASAFSLSVSVHDSVHILSYALTELFVFLRATLARGS